MSAEFRNDPSLPDVIEMKNVGQKYGSKVVIDGLNMLIEHNPSQGKFVVVLGQSGCGKSTVLRYISGLQVPTSGEITIRSQKQTGQIKCGMVFQKYSSLPWLTTLENVELGLKFRNGKSKKEIRDTAMGLLEMVELQDHANKYAQYPTLSGGQLQRIAIARSLATSPDILLMDEPFGALDIHTRLKMQQMLAKMWLQINPTIIFVTHDVSEAVFLADEIWIMAANPGYIHDRIQVNLPTERTKEMKRSPEFIKFVHQIEDLLSMDKFDPLVKTI